MADTTRIRLNPINDTARLDDWLRRVLAEAREHRERKRRKMAV